MSKEIEKLDEIKAKLEKAKADIEVKDRGADKTVSGGVHTSVDGAKGKSKAGIATAIGDKEFARDAHVANINQMRTSPNPKLTKAGDLDWSELEKIGGGQGMAGSVNSTGGPSIASQIGFGKEEDKHEDKTADEKLIDKKIEQHEDKKHSLESHQAEHDKMHCSKAGELDWSELTRK